MDIDNLLKALEGLQAIDNEYSFRPTKLVLYKQRKVDSVSRESIPGTAVYWAEFEDHDGRSYLGCSDKSYDDAVGNARERFREEEGRRPKRDAST